MQNYRLKFLDPQNVDSRKIDSQTDAVTGRDFQGSDDLAALAAAERACVSHDVEVWQGARRVARVKMGNAPLDEADHESL